MNQFLTIDGPDGVGKTTVAHVLADRLRGDGFNVLMLHQPSESDLGRFAYSGGLTGLALAAAVVGDRYLQIETEIKPAMADGRTVVCDRYVASTLALQRLDAVPLDVLWSMNDQAMVPDLSIHLTAEPSVIEERLDRRGRTSRFEAMNDIAALESAFFNEAFTLLRGASYPILEVDTTAKAPEVVVAEIAARLGSLR
jgi:dTMP kinase